MLMDANYSTGAVFHAKPASATGCSTEGRAGMRERLSLTSRVGCMSRSLWQTLLQRASLDIRVKLLSIIQYN